MVPVATGSTGIVVIRALLVATTLPTLVFRIGDSRIDEASGIAVGLRSPGVVYVQNDSGDRNRFFAIDAHTGATAATITVPGATNVDWEDLAVATDAVGTPSVWLADIGDNGASRDEIRVYRVPEPSIAATSRDRTITTARPEVYRLRYPDGPHDAESIAVAPGGAAYVVTKAATGNSTVYRLPTRPSDTTVRSLQRVGSVSLGLGGLATGAAISADGSRLVIRTYTDAFVWGLTYRDVTTALTRTPTRVRLPAQRQGEGVTFDGDSLLVDSEGIGQPVYSVPVPDGRPPAASTDPTPRLISPPFDEPDETGFPLGWVVAAVAAVLILTGLGGVLHRRSRKRG